jgi:hypothetical protein
MSLFVPLLEFNQLVLLHCIHFEGNIVAPEYGPFDLAVLNEASRKTGESQLARLLRDCVPAKVSARAEVRVEPPVGEIPTSRAALTLT